MRGVDFYLGARLQGKIYALHHKGLKALTCWREGFLGFCFNSSAIILQPSSSHGPLNTLGRSGRSGRCAPVGLNEK